MPHFFEANLLQHYFLDVKNSGNKNPTSWEPIDSNIMLSIKK